MSTVETIPSLVERARAGDQAAFAELVYRFQAMAYGYAYSILGDFPLAEDAAQGAFVEAYRKLEDLREPAAFPGWFRRIVFKNLSPVSIARTTGMLIFPSCFMFVASINPCQCGSFGDSARECTCV